MGKERKEQNKLKGGKDRGVGDNTLSFIFTSQLRAHCLYLDYFKLLSKDTPVSPHYRVAELAQTASSHLKCMLGC